MLLKPRFSLQKMICNGDPVFFITVKPGKEQKMEKKINRGVNRTGETDIKLHLIDSFPNHPYHVFDDEDMTELAASIEANGLLNPIIVRSKADGRYELISGHRRKRAYEILKINKIRAIIVDITDDEAIIMMVGKIKEGDIITHIDGKKITHDDMVLDIIESKKAGEKITVTVINERGSSTTFEIELKANVGESSYSNDIPNTNTPTIPGGDFNFPEGE